MKEAARKIILTIIVIAAIMHLIAIVFVGQSYLPEVY